MLFSKHFTVKAKTKIQLFFQVPNISQLQFAEPLIMHTSVISLANSLSTTPHPINTCSAMKSQTPSLCHYTEVTQHSTHKIHTALYCDHPSHTIFWPAAPR